MSHLELKWTKFSTVPLPRSSHSVSVVGGFAYIFGGEIKPRQPVDNVIHKVGMENGAYERLAAIGNAPSPRVGHVAAAIGNQVYIFGGRGGPAMNPLHEDGGVYCFDSSTASWSFLPSSSSDYPCARSYHCATSTPTHLIVHAGCGAAPGSRFNDIWAFDTKSHEWSRLADAPGDPRGGSSICYSEGKVWRFGGFNGKTEVGGAIDCLSISTSPSSDFLSSSWETICFADAQATGSEASLKHLTDGPEPRSVCGLVSVGQKIVTLFGEGNPSPTGGHDAAGHFWGDAWTFDPATKKWNLLEIDDKAGKPGERGWFAASATNNGLILWGGIDGNNDRLGDGWLLSARTNAEASASRLTKG